MLSTACKNTMLDAFGVTHLSLHSAYSTTGASELSGGSPAYARKAATFNAAASESRALSAAVTFDVAASATAKYVGKWTAITAGTFLGMSALGGTEKEFHADLTENKILSSAHGLATNDLIVFIGGTPPGGLTEGTEYYVITATTHDFQVSATQGGLAIDLTSQAVGKCVVSKIIPETFGSQGTLQVSSLTVNLKA